MLSMRRVLLIKLWKRIPYLVFGPISPAQKWKTIPMLASVRKLALMLTVLTCCACHGALGEEFRGLWVDAWTTGIKTPQQVAEMVEFAKANRFNAIFVQVRRRGDVFYGSSFEPRPWDCAPDFDALTLAVRLGHEAGLEVHAWLIMCPVGITGPKPTKPNHPMNRHADWLCQDNTGEKLHAKRDYYLDPGIPGAQDYLYDICMEVVRKYPLDGLHLDYFRYPSIEWGYNPLALDRFKKESNRTDTPPPLDKDWQVWRKNQLTILLERIRKGVSEARPKLRLSLSCYSPSGVASSYCLQDWESWLDKGLLDFAVPMAFSRNEPNWKERLNDALADHADRVYVGIGSYLISPEETISHIKDIRAMGGKGFLLYSYGSSAANVNSPEAITKISEAAFPEPDSLPW